MPRYNQPSEGTENWNIPLNENFADLGIEVTNEVATFSDLPDSTGEISSQGLPRRYLVRESRVVYRDTGQGWQAVAGLGTESTPVPGTGYFESLDTGTLSGGLFSLTNGGTTVHLENRDGELVATDDSGNSYTVSDPSDGGASSNTYGPFGTNLVGSHDVGDPSSGLANEISNALVNDMCYINITGYWTMDGEVSMDSTDHSPRGVLLDATGANIEYGGSGWAITNDCTGNVAGQIKGGYLHLYGGNWEATGSPDGLYRGIDVCHNIFWPRRTDQWNSDGTTEVCRWERGTRWCESNTFSGFHNQPDIALRGYDNNDPPNSSFQDNFILDAQIGGVQNGAAAFDLSGNWIDCAFMNPTVIASSEGSAAFRHNANMNGTVIFAPEVENAASGATHYLADIGPDARAGPLQIGGDHVAGDTFNNIANGSWTWAHMRNLGGSFEMVSYGNRGAPMKWEFENGRNNFNISTAPDANSSFSKIFNVDHNGNLVLSGSITENGSP